jgi:hypothetical protein
MQPLDFTRAFTFAEILLNCEIYPCALPDSTVRFLLDRLAVSLYMVSRIYVQRGKEPPMPPIHISDAETDELVRRLAARRSLGLTEAIRLAVSNELSKDGPEAMPPPSKEPQGGDVAKLDEEMRSTTLEYTRLLAKHRGKKGVGSRVYQMLARHGSIDTLGRLVSRPTEGLTFLHSIGRLDLSAEEIALKYKDIIPEDIRARARANLRKIGAR